MLQVFTFEVNAGSTPAAEGQGIVEYGLAQKRPYPVRASLSIASWGMSIAPVFMISGSRSNLTCGPKRRQDNHAAVRS